MKQYMVLKMVGAGLKGALQIVPLLAMVTQAAAEEAVQRFRQEEPDSVFLIQEVGLA